MITLKDTGLFHEVEPFEIQKMMKCSGAVTKEYKTGDYIFREEDMPQFLYLILEGEVSIVKDFATGRQDILYVAGAGEVFGEDFFCPEQKPYWFNAVANEKSIILLFPWKVISCASTGAKKLRYMAFHTPMHTPVTTVKTHRAMSTGRTRCHSHEYQ